VNCILILAGLAGLSTVQRCDEPSV